MKNITVVGAGTMGNGIAHVFAQKNYKVNLVDISQDSLDKAIKVIEKNLTRMVEKEKISLDDKEDTLANIKISTNLKKSVESADLIVEAATENKDLKLKIFSDLSELCKKDAILASNTSSISITEIANSTKYPSNVIGMHFMNPVPIMKLVEVIKGKDTDDSVTEKIMNLSKTLGKIPVEVNDAPGFVANRILMPMINEAVYALYEGVASVEDIDIGMKLGCNQPMGPLELADFIGLDTCLAIMDVMYEGFNDKKYLPSKLLVDMVNNGNLGVKSGEGFYDYSEGLKNKKVSSRFN